MVAECSDCDIFECRFFECLSRGFAYCIIFFQNLKNGIRCWLCYLDVCTKWELFGKSLILLSWSICFSQCLAVSRDSMNSDIWSIVSLHYLECPRYLESMLALPPFQNKSYVWWNFSQTLPNQLECCQKQCKCCCWWTTKSNNSVHLFNNWYLDLMASTHINTVLGAPMLSTQNGGLLVKLTTLL